MLTLEEVKKIATLARIEVSPQEQKRYAETISAVLDYMTILNEVDTAGVEPTAQVTGLMDVVREDTASDWVNREALVQSFPQVKEGRLVVPAVF